MAGLLVAQVEDGKIVESASQSSISNSQKTDTNSAYSKDTFLQLLVAEVQNQDPLEPTSNTEWISQYATFSELEAMTNMSASYDLSRASALVGKTVVLQTTDSTGKSSTIQGKVDYVTYESGEAYLSVNGGLYSLDDLYNVVDTDYMDAFDKVYNWTVNLNKLPSSTASLDWDDVETVEDLYEQYEAMSDYEKTFVATDNSDKITEYHERAQELIKIHEAAQAAAEAEEAGETEETEEAEDTETDDTVAEIEAAEETEEGG